MRQQSISLGSSGQTTARAASTDIDARDKAWGCLGEGLGTRARLSQHLIRVSLGIYHLNSTMSTMIWPPLESDTVAERGAVATSLLH